MMMMMMRVSPVLGLTCLLALPHARAEDAPPSQGERERIAAQRQVAEQQYVEREAECRKRFVVTSCIDKARADKRQTLDNLHQQEIALDEVERQQRSAEHKRRREAKAWEEINKPAPEPRPAREPKAPKEPSSVLPRRAASAPSAEDRSAAEQRSRERYEARRKEAEAHRAAVEKRNQERAGKKAKPLPVPPAASAP